MREKLPDHAEAVLDRMRKELATARFAYVFGSVLTAACGDGSDLV